MVGSRAHQPDRRAVHAERGIPLPLGRPRRASTAPGRKRLVHPVAGTLDLDFEVMEFPAHPGLTMLAYTAPAGTPTADSLRMPASWAITAEKAGELPAHA